jgi:hypothetical protein
VVRAITPVPGGVGPVTTMMLLEQTVQAAERSVGDGDPWTEAMPVRSEQPTER